jgi:hypothetical protein
MNPLTPMLVATITADRRREAETAMRARAARRRPAWRRSDPAHATVLRRAVPAVTHHPDRASGHARP